MNKKMDNKEYKEILQKIVDLPGYKYVNIAKENAIKVLDYMHNMNIDEKAAMTMVLAFIASIVGADGRYTFEEHEFIQEVFSTSIDYDFMYNFVKNTNAKSIEIMDETIDVAPKAIKDSFICLALSACAYDGEITSEEQALIIKYIL